jgi:hypothetical protein
MKLYFPHFEDLSTNNKIKDKHFEIIRAMMCEKLIAINNNPNLTKELIEEHLHLVKDETSFYVSEKASDCIIITFKFNLFELFDCEFDLSMYVYYDDTGQQTHYTAQYKGDLMESTLINYLNLNHFNNGANQLEFYIQKDYYGSTYAIKQKHWVILLHLRKIANMTYFFDKDHKICRKTFELKNIVKSSGTSYSLNSNGDVETEMMLLRFTKHVMNVKSEVDSSFFNPKTINLEDNNWFKVVNNSFYDNFNGDNKVAFMDYLKLIEMIEI